MIFFIFFRKKDLHLLRDLCRCIEKLQDNIRSSSKAERTSLFDEINANLAEIERLEALLESVKEGKNSGQDSEAIVKLDDAELEIEYILLDKAKNLSEITSSLEPSLAFHMVLPPPLKTLEEFRSKNVCSQGKLHRDRSRYHERVSGVSPGPWVELSKHQNSSRNVSKS